MTKEEKKQAKAQKAEQRKKAKEERKQIFNEISAKKKAMKTERQRLLKLYAEKEVELKNKYKADLNAAGNNKNQIKTIKKQYKQNLWDLHNQRDYAVAKYYVGEKTQRKQKMIVDKRIAYKEYKQQHEILHDNLKKELDTIKKEHKDNVVNLKKQYRPVEELKLLKDYNQQTKPFKVEYKKQAKVLKAEYKKNTASIKKQYKLQADRTNNLDKARADYESKLNTASANYEAKCQEVRTKLNMKYDLKALNSNLIDESNRYESKYIQAKVNYKNKDIQLKQKRDLSYEYELDATFTLRRWFFGVGKEFQRMSWPGPKKTIRDLLIVLAITLFLAVVFLIIDVILNAAHIM